MRNGEGLAERVFTESRHEDCAKHGGFDSRLLFGKVWTKCPACSGEENAEKARIESEKDAEKKATKWGLQVRNAGIPERFRDRTFKNYIVETPGQQKALAIAIEFSGNLDESLRAGRSLIMCGRLGTGKTHLSCAIGLDAMQKNKRVMFTTVVRAIRRVKDTWSKQSQETESKAVEALTTPDLLILDEVGVQFGTDTEQMILFDILNERYEKRKSTILISNLSLDDLKKHLGERLFDRMREDGGKYIPFEWEGFRVRKEVSFDVSAQKLEELHIAGVMP